MAGAAKARLTAVVAKIVRARWFIIFFPPQSMRPHFFTRSRLFWIWIQQPSDPLKSPHQGRSLLSAVTASIGSDDNVREPARLQRAISPNLVSPPAPVFAEAQEIRRLGRPEGQVFRPINP
jgi:hypothetical protein